MTALFLTLLLLVAEPFWNTKLPADWSIEEVISMLRQSPWSTVSAASSGPAIRAHVASAAPMREAEAKERQAFRTRQDQGASFEDYQEMLATGKFIALAVLLRDAIPTSDGVEARSLEHNSILHVGHRSYKLVTHFPPTAGDPYLRYIFPRAVKPGDKALLFDIYVPGIVYPQRHIEFDLREMKYRGKIEY